ncbi:hypothetical protein OB236_30985 [Paenibacillus sp. WQ 127069]|uniref:Uncharacterized protein n=1 Tax=Paenibacillus baimaensis TaxID=2982185 RepID=A0ABT2UPI7_9BACL|nr:hypothetical protein [Paenibacillus sp. WQ 127069]MCU6796559.1 hypothetical protein [Paenibacillus sp. WQ 127069]
MKDQVLPGTVHKYHLLARQIIQHKIRFFLDVKIMIKVTFATLPVTVPVTPNSLAGISIVLSSLIP